MASDDATRFLKRHRPSASRRRAVESTIAAEKWAGVHIVLHTSNQTLTMDEMARLRTTVKYFEAEPDHWQLLMSWLHTPAKYTAFPRRENSIGRDIHRAFWFLLCGQGESDGALDLAKANTVCPRACDPEFQLKWQSLQTRWQQQFREMFNGTFGGQRTRFDPFLKLTDSDVQFGKPGKFGKQSAALPIYLLFQYDIVENQASSAASATAARSPSPRTMFAPRSVCIGLHQLNFYFFVFKSGLKDAIQRNPDMFQIMMCDGQARAYQSRALAQCESSLFRTLMELVLV